MNLNEFIARATSFFDKAESKQNTEAASVAKLQADLAASTTENTALKSQAAESAKKITDLEAALAAKDSEITALKASVETEKNKANETIAAQGLPADKAPAAEAGKDSILTQFFAIEDPTQRARFWADHKSEIVAARK